MTEDFNPDAFRYLLDELDAGERAAFESRLARDPAARLALADCAAAVAQFALESAPAEALAPGDQRAILTAVLSAAGATPAKRPVPATWKRFGWPLAAAALLVLNLLQFFRPPSPDAIPAPPPGLPPPTPVVRHSSPAENPASEAVADELRRLEQLRAEYANLELARNTLRADNEAMIRRRALIDKRIGRLAAMELVDPASYARGERRGLVAIARGLLTEPGIVISDPADRPPAQQPDNPAAVSPGATPPPQTPSTGQPYAWSVFDEEEARGYLNYYNLPTVPPDQSLQLWVKQAGSSTYQNVGEVTPPNANGAGSVTYPLPKGSPPPTEVLITQEPRNATPIQPTSGTAVVRGP